MGAKDRHGVNRDEKRSLIDGGASSTAVMI